MSKAIALCGVACACAVALAACAGAPAPAPVSHVREVPGTATIATIVEDFDQGPAVLALGKHVGTWGPRVLDASADVDIVDAGAGGSGKAVRYAFEASFDRAFEYTSWRDSGLDFLGTADLGISPKGSEGVAFSLRPHGFTLVEVYLVQEVFGEEKAWYVPLFVNDGQWKAWKIPFSAFVPAEGARALDPAKPIRLDLHVSYTDNWLSWSFRGAPATSAEPSFMLDELGFWRSTTPADPRMLATWDDERDTMPLTLVLYGSSEWTDYSTSDAGVSRMNDGVTAQVLTLTRKEGGPEGTYLELAGRLRVTPAIAAYHRANQALTLFLKAPITATIPGAQALAFQVRSSIAAGAGLEIQDEANNRYYGAELRLGTSWKRVRVLYNELKSEGGPLSTAAKVGSTPRLQIAFELPPDVVEKAAASGGVLEFTLDLDGVRFE